MVYSVFQIILKSTTLPMPNSIYAYLCRKITARTHKEIISVMTLSHGERIGIREPEWEINFTIKYFKLLKIIKINIYLNHFY